MGRFRSYIQMVKDAIKSLGERDGSSQHAIKKHIIAHERNTFEQRYLRAALKNGVESGVLIMVKRSFKLAIKKKAPKKKAARARPAAQATPSLPAPSPSASGTVIQTLNLEAGCQVLREGNDLLDIDLAFTDATANSNKFYRIQVVVSDDEEIYWLGQHWGRIGTVGQHQVKEFGSKDKALKEFKKKFKSKTGVDFADRGAATSNASGKYRTVTERLVAEEGGRTADAATLCVAIEWKDQMDLDLHCKLPDGSQCYYQSKNPTSYIELDVDKTRGGVENIYLKAGKCMDGDYDYFVRYYSGHGNPVKFTMVCNQFGKKINEGVSVAKCVKSDTPCLTLTMKKGKVVKTKFHFKTSIIN